MAHVKTTSPPPITFGNPRNGFLCIGEEDDKKVLRKSEIQMSSGSASELRLFKDGGWELKSSDNDKGSYIIQKGNGALNILSEGDINIECKGTFGVKANDIILETTNCDDGDIVCNAKHNFKVNALNYAIISSTDVTIDAKNKLISFSENMNYIIGRFINFHESMSQIIPPTHARNVKKLTDTLDTNNSYRQFDLKDQNLKKEFEEERKRKRKEAIERIGPTFG